MKFINFLSENRKTILSDDEIIKLLNDQCSLTKNKPFYRGSNSADKAYIVDSTSSARKSLTGSNNALIYFDYIGPKENKNYQRRAHSTIFSGDIDTADSFGRNIFLVFPFDDAMLCNVYDDFNNNYFEFKDSPHDLYRFFRRFDKVNNIDELFKEIENYDFSMSDFDEYLDNKDRIKQIEKKNNKKGSIASLFNLYWNKVF